MGTNGSVVGDASKSDELPLVDEHSVGIAASGDLVWIALERYVSTSLRGVEGSLVAKLLQTRPATGFEVSESQPGEILTLVGSHRFSHYKLSFALKDTGDGLTEVSATTYALFPGVGGGVYRFLVIGTRAHVIATNHVLRSIRRRALEAKRQRTPDGTAG